MQSPPLFGFRLAASLYYRDQVHFYFIINVYILKVMKIAKQYINKTEWPSALKKPRR